MDSNLSCERPVLFPEAEESYTELLVHHSQMLGIRREDLHGNGWLALFNFGHEKRRLPLVNFNFVNMNGSDPGSHSHVFALGAEVHTGRDFLCPKFLQHTDGLRLLHKIPFVDHTIFTRDDKSIRVGPNCRTDNRGHNGFQKDLPFLLFSIDFLELRSLKQRDTSIVVDNDEVITNEVLIVPQFVVADSTVPNGRRVAAVFLQI